MMDPKRLSALRRLYLAKLEKISQDLPHDLRGKLARAELDKVLGFAWRDEVKEAGEELDPTDGACEEGVTDRLVKATEEEGYKGLDVPTEEEAYGEKLEEKPRPKLDHKPNSILIRLVKLLG